MYVRTDGRIFDYAFDQNVPERECLTRFHDHALERTGRYAPISSRDRLNFGKEEREASAEEEAVIVTPNGSLLGG